MAHGDTKTMKNHWDNSICIGKQANWLKYGKNNFDENTMPWIPTLETYKCSLRMYCIDRPRVPESNVPCLFQSLYD